MNYTKLRIQEKLDNLVNELKWRIQNIKHYKNPFKTINNGYVTTDAVGTVTFQSSYIAESNVESDDATCQNALSVIGEHIIGESVTLQSAFCYTRNFSKLNSNSFQYINLSGIEDMRLAQEQGAIAVGVVKTLICPQKFTFPSYSSGLLSDYSGSTYTMRLLQLPEYIYGTPHSRILDTWASGRVTLRHVVVPPNYNYQYVWLQYFVLGEDCMKELAESIPDKSSTSGTWQVKIGATNLANLSEETINLFETKGWTLA